MINLGENRAVESFRYVDQLALELTPEELAERTNWEEEGLHYSGRLLIDALPDELLERISTEADRDGQRPIAVDFLGQEDLMSFVSLNEDGTKTVFAFNEPIKYLCSATDEIRFIGSTEPAVETRTNRGVGRSIHNIDGTTVLRHIDPSSISSATYHTRQFDSSSALSTSRNMTENAAIYAMVENVLSDRTATASTMSTTEEWQSFDVTTSIQEYISSELSAMPVRSSSALSINNATQIDTIDAEGAFLAVTFSEDTSLADGIYFVRNRRSNMPLDVAEASTRDGADVWQWVYNRTLAHNGA